MSDAAGGYIRTPEDTGRGFRLTAGMTVLSRRAVEDYGLDLLRRIFPDSEILIAEDLLESDPSDGQVRPETPGGPR